MIRDKHHGERCPYCQRVMDRGSFHLQPTRDHVIPRSRGGVAKIVCCLKCNGIKADMLPDVWAAYMAANPGWWLLSRAERKARRRQDQHLAKFRSVAKRQGSPPMPPVIVPPELVFNFGHD